MQYDTVLQITDTSVAVYQVDVYRSRTSETSVL